MATLAVRSLGMRILYNSRSRAAPGVEEAVGARYVASVEELAAKADVLSLHCHGGAETHHLIDATMIARMKPEAILINTARGSVVNERSEEHTSELQSLMRISYAVLRSKKNNESYIVYHN